MSAELYMLQELSKMFFPKEISENFIIVKLDSTEDSMLIHLEELDIIHSVEDGHKYEKNGFYAASLVRDFPIRDRKVTLSIKRRRWIDTTTGKSYSNNYAFSVS